MHACVVCVLPLNIHQTEHALHPQGHVRQNG